MSTHSWLTRILGSVDWQPPPWWSAIAARVDRFGSWARRRRGAAAGAGAGLLLVALAVLGASWWWQHRPQPQFLGVTVTPPAARDLEDPLSKPSPLLLSFAEPAAPLEAIGKAPAGGIVLEPRIEGRWTWSDESTLSFQPAGDWPVGQRYVARLEPARLLRPGVRLERDALEFGSAAFVAELRTAEFYQDPTEPQLRKVVVTLHFSHPVEPRSLEQAFSLRAADAPRGLLGGGARSLPFRASYDEKHLNAYLHSEPLAMPEQESALEVGVAPGVRSSLGGPALAAPLVTQVKVPGRFSLGVQQAGLSFVTNERLEGEQVLTIEASAGVAPAELQRRVHAWLLPLRHPDAARSRPDAVEGGQRAQPFAWTTPALVAPEVLATAEKLALEPIEADGDHPTVHAFRYRAAPGRYLYVQVEKGLKAWGGYELGRRWDTTLQVPPLPQEVRILQSGALLSLRGERRLALYSRDVPAIRYEIGRVLPERLALLATQAGGNFATPEFHAWSFSADDLTELRSSVETVAAAAPGRVQYHGLDLGPYIAPDGAARSGVFMVRALAWDPQRRVALGARDERLVLVTDLGLLVKRAVDGTEDVFVQSVARGEPVAGATVQVLGRNGMAVATRTTDAQGHAALPSLRGLARDREPAMYLVRKDEDLSFLPIQRTDRGIDLSRFDVGGVANAAEAGQLSAYLFSDRGIYRPGDAMRIGMIVKAADWARPLAGLPLEAVISDPRGNVVRRQRIRLGAAGFEELTHATAESAPTGAYDVALYIVKDGAADARLGGTTVNVQEFLPDRLKLALRFSSERLEGWVAPEALAAQVALRTLFDTPAAGRRIATTLRLTPRVPRFAAWKDYAFVDPFKAGKSFEDALADATTGDDGEVALPLNLQRFAPGTYSLQVVTQAYEAGGGRAVTQARDLLVSSLPWLVGLKADGDLGYVSQGSRRSVSIVAVDPALAATAVADLRLALLERRWVSVLARQPDGTLRYESRLREQALREEKLALPAAAVERTLATDSPGEFALVVREAGGRELNRVQYSVAGAGNVARSLDRNAELEIRLARTDYAPGEEIELSIRAPYAGAGLIAIERERVHAFRWFRSETAASVQRIRLPEGFDGNGYVTVTFVRDANSAEIFTSPLSYGAVPFSVDLARRKVEVSLEAPQRVKPGEPLEVRYRAAQASRLVLFGVDEGILQVAGWRNPDPLAHFFAKRALEVDTRQILDLILPEFRQFMQAAPGGDAEGGGARYLNPFKRRRDQPVVFWSGIVDAGPQPRSFRYVVPDTFNGTLRIVAVAVAPGAIGVGSAAAVSRGDYVVLPNVPLSVAPGDEFEVTASVSNDVAGSGPAARVTATLEPSKHFEVLGAAAQPLAVAEGREGVVRFRVRARSVLGGGELRWTVAAGAHRATVASGISVRPAGVRSAQLRFGTLRGTAAEQPLERRLLPELRAVEATLSGSPLAIAGGLEGWLDEYPYGCTEQLVSKALPAVVLAARPGLGAGNLAAAPERYQRLLLELRARQNADGGFGYWPGDAEAVAWPSIYALHLLVEAQQRGQGAPADVLERGGEWLGQFAAGESGSLGEARARAYAIYVLTRMGRVASNHAAAAIEHLDRDFKGRWRGDITAAFLAAAYHNMRQARLAAELIDGVRFAGARGGPFDANALRAAAAGEADAGTIADDGARSIGFAYGPAVHDLQLLYLLARHFPERLRAGEADALAAIAAGAKRAPNTQSAAWGVLALDAWAGAVERAPPAQLAITARAADGKATPLEVRAGPVLRAALPSAATAVRFASQGEATAFWTITESGFDAVPPTSAAAQGIEVAREYLDAAGKPVAQARQGDELRVRVRFRSTSRRAYWDGVIVDVLPGGVEPILDDLIRRPQQAEGEEEGEGGAGGGAVGDGAHGWYPEHVELREDRVIAFGPILPTASTLEYRVRVTSAGRFVVPPAHAESMYDPMVRAHSAAARLAVEPR
ncbi:MAG: alpha-2-macroglobulin [Steroidobacteraceae bacterium]